MADTEASEAARTLVRRRWGSQVVSRAVLVVVDRAAELDEAQRAQLREIAGDPARTGDDAR
jgi:hypothetical protein